MFCIHSICPVLTKIHILHLCKTLTGNRADLMIQKHEDKVHFSLRRADMQLCDEIRTLSFCNICSISKIFYFLSQKACSHFCSVLKTILLRCEMSQTFISRHRGSPMARKISQLRNKGTVESQRLVQLVEWPSCKSDSRDTENFRRLRRCSRCTLILRRISFR